MYLKNGELRKYKSIRGNLFLIENDKGALRAYKLTPVALTKEMSHMFKAQPENGPKKSEKKVPKEWCEHVFTAEEMCNLLSGGEIFVEDFVSSRTGMFFSAWVSWNGSFFNIRFPKNKE